MNRTMHLDLEMEAVSLRSAWLISRACRPGRLSPHLALDFGAGRQGGDGVDDHDVHGPRTDQGVHDLQRLLAGVRLRHQKIVQIDAQLLGVNRIQRVFGIDEGGDPAPSSAPRRPCAGPGWSCPTIQGRTPRSPARPAGRRCPAPCPDPASRSRRFRSRSPRPPCRASITEPLPKARSICAIAASRARCLSPSSLPTNFNAACEGHCLRLPCHDSRH